MRLRAGDDTTGFITEEMSKFRHRARVSTLEPSLTVGEQKVKSQQRGVKFQLLASRGSAM